MVTNEQRDYYETRNQYQVEIEIELSNIKYETERMFQECNAI